MKKTLGQIARDAWQADQSWEDAAQAVKRAVLCELRREGRLDRPTVTWPPGGTYEYPKKNTKARKK